MTHEEYVERRDDIFDQVGWTTITGSDRKTRMDMTDKAAEAIDQLVLDVIGEDEVDPFAIAPEIGAPTEFRNKAKELLRKIVTGK